MLYFYDFIGVYVFTTNHHLKPRDFKADFPRQNVDVLVEVNREYLPTISLFGRILR